MLAAESGTCCWIRDGADFDLVVEGDAPELVRALASDRGGEAIVHQRFGTAAYRHGDIAFDLATSRTENYSRPGVLPDVRPGPIEEDLKRRDFTVNSMAIPLSPPNPGSLLDRFGGRDDLERGQIRALHDGSFVDDPTRIMRAIRYEQRLGFQIEAHTLGLMSHDLHLLPAVGADRLRREIELFLLEPEPELQFGRAEGLGIIDVIEPGLNSGPDCPASSHQHAETWETSIPRSTCPAALQHGKTDGLHLPGTIPLPQGQIQTVFGALDLRDRETS